MDKKMVKLLAWYSKQSEVVQTWVHERQIEIRRTYLNDCRMRNETPEKTAAMERSQFHQAVKDLFRRQSDSRLSTRDNLAEVDLKRVEEAKAATRRKSPKRDKLMTDLRPVVEKLRSEDASWEGVSNYIARHHAKKISRGYLQKVFAQATKEGSAASPE